MANELDKLAVKDAMSRLAKLLRQLAAEARLAEKGMHVWAEKLEKRT